MSADPRGPERTVVAAERKPEATYVTLKECGHVRPMNQIYHYKIGSQVRCFECGPCFVMEPSR